MEGERPLIWSSALAMEKDEAREEKGIRQGRKGKEERKREEKRVASIIPTFLRRTREKEKKKYLLSFYRRASMEREIQSLSKEKKVFPFLSQERSGRVRLSRKREKGKVFLFQLNW